MGSEDPALAIAARHALHDEELVVAFASDGDDAEDAARARTLIERCQACRDLHDDVVAIGAALRSVPQAQAAAAIQRPRDYRLSVATANQLRPGSVVLRLRDRIREAIASFGRPVGMSLASLGVVGLLLGTLTLGGSAGLGQAPEDASFGGDAGAANASVAPAATEGAKLETQDTGGLTGQVGSPRETVRESFDILATASATSTSATASPATTSSSATPAPSTPVVPPPNPGAAASTGPTLSALIVVGSIALLIVGVALLVAGSRRREPIPGR